MAATVLGHAALLLDLTSPRAASLPDRRPRLPQTLLPHIDLLVLAKRDQPPPFISSKGFDSEADHWTRRDRAVSARVKANEEDFESDEDGNGDARRKEWELELRRRLKEVEEMEELEKKAEELQTRAEGEEGGDVGGSPEEESEEEKRMRVRKELEKVAQEQAERRATAQLMFELGQKAYGRGTYGRAIEFLEAALTIIPRPTLFGGEIQIWLAMAYEANNRHTDCILLYKQLEERHPSISIRRQAAELRYILQAPKLKISEEEMVTIPLIGSSYDSYAATWTDKYKDRDENRTYTTTNHLPSTRDFLGDFLVWRPPVGLEKSTVFWVALTAWLGLVGAALILQR
ncbi:hypothetical protein MLD38_017031 [Melastoma candidum]|uniref:Uncharacterized protein n=1 Tax=Melastoma candidum TaxID=119954 RepID=A0ACB9QNK6_9MYRT|nr:hypothetical protein MLD38_017031 [Melastoma candidum]